MTMTITTLAESFCIDAQHFLHRQRLNEERRADVVFYRTPSLIEQKDQLLHQSSLVVHSSFEKMDKRTLQFIKFVWIH